MLHGQGNRMRNRHRRNAWSDVLYGTGHEAEGGKGVLFPSVHLTSHHS
jgi:hypothetical protein